MSEVNERNHMECPAPPDINFAEIAVELKLCQHDMLQVSYALLLESVIRHERARNLELLAARIGLDTEIARRIVCDAQRRVELLGAAHLYFKSLIPHEAEINRLLATAATAATSFRGATQ